MTCHAAHSKGSGTQREICTNHPGTPATEKCTRCRKPHCPACLNSAKMCFRCALLPPAGEGAKRGTGKLKARGTGALKKPKASLLDKPGIKQGLSGLSLVLVLAGVWWGGGPDFYGLNKHALPPYTGPGAVAITSPKSGTTLKGTQRIKIQVGAPQHLEKLELTVDGKYWQRFTAPPFETEWETQIFKRGTHVLVAKAYYRGGKRVVVSKPVRVKTQNAGQ